MHQPSALAAFSSPCLAEDLPPPLQDLNFSQVEPGRACVGKLKRHQRNEVHTVLDRFSFLNNSLIGCDFRV
jgi:hypothetical protein